LIAVIPRLSSSVVAPPPPPANPTSTNSLKYNTRLVTDEHRFQAAGEPLAIIDRIGVNRGRIIIADADLDRVLVDETIILATFTNAAPVNGEMWRDDSTGLFQFRENGATVGLAGGGGGATTELDNLGITAINADLLFDASTYDIGDSTNRVDNLNVNTVRLRSGSGVANIPSIFSSTGLTLDFNIPTGSTMNLYENLVPKHSWSQGTYTAPNIIVNESLFISNNGLFPVTEGFLQRNNDTISLYIPIFEIMNATSVDDELAQLNLTKVDPNPANGDLVAEINFLTRDTGVEVEYGSILVENIDVTDNAVMSFLVRANNGLVTAMSLTGDDNNQRFMMICAGSDQFRIQPGLGRMAYFVTPQVFDFSANIGTAGTIEIPQFSNASPSVNDLNSTLGAFDGAMGHNTSDGKLYIRKSATVWSFYNESGTII